MIQNIFRFLLLLLPVRAFAQTNIYESNGNVGIGISTPQAKLHVNGGQIIETNGITSNTRTLTLKNTGTNQINFQSYHGSSRSTIQIQNNDATLGLFFAPPEVGYNYSILRSINGGFKIDVGGNFSNIGSNALTIETNGNVGIGTSTPTYKLQVEGDQYLSSSLSIGTHNSMGYGPGITLNGNYDLIGISRYNIESDRSELRVNIGDDGNDYFTIGYHSYVDGNWIPAVKVGASGAMSIGVSTIPSGYRLAVGGNIIAEKVRVQLQPWADYVFEPSYKLPSLKEVEQYIKQNKHLPEVPTAKEVAANGIDLGDNQAVLLKKIEELTLYIIQQQKEIEGLKKEMKTIKHPRK